MKSISYCFNMLMIHSFLVVIELLICTSLRIDDATTTDDKLCKSSDMLHYENYDELTKLLKCYHMKYPHITKLGSVGKSVQGRELWYMQITDNPKIIEDGEPMFKYVGNMHGNEVISRQVLIYLIQYLCDHYDKDSRVGSIIDSTNIFILPSMNPDGFERAKEGNCGTFYKSGQITGRNNANNKDLNRNFPDQFSNWNTYKISSDAEPETKALMHWIYKMPFVLSANLHGGSVVASYPFDSNKQMISAKVYSKAPDDIFFKHLALTYAKHHPIMKTGKPNCPGSRSETFTNGITNGAYWYNVPGGMQDFNYLISNCFEITLELSCCKYPLANALKKEWQNNKESLLSYIEQVHRGIKGKVVDADNVGIEKAEITIVGINHKIKSIENGDYWRLLLPGVYTVQVAAKGYKNLIKHSVKVVSTEATELDFVLEKEGHIKITTPVARTSSTVKRSTAHGLLSTVSLLTGTTVHATNATRSIPTSLSTSSKPTDLKLQTTSTPVITAQTSTSPFPPTPATGTNSVYHTYDSMTSHLDEHRENHSDIMKLHEISQSNGKSVWCVELTNDVNNKYTKEKSNIALIAGLRGYDTIGREILLKFVNHILTSKGTLRIRKLLNSTRIFIIPMVTVHGMDEAVSGDCSGEKYPKSGDDFYNKFSFPKSSGEPKEVSDLKVWLKENQFLFSALVEGGEMLVSYPPNTEAHDDRVAGKSTADEEFLKSIALHYAVHNKKIYSGKSCDGIQRNRGVTTGIEWKNERNTLGMYAYLAVNQLQVNVHLACCHNPPAAELHGIWLDNKESLLQLAGMAKSRIYGKVTDIRNTIIKDTTVRFSGTDAYAVVDTETGYYQKYVTPRKYTVTAEQPALDSVSAEIAIRKNTPVRHDFMLLEKPKFEHHKYKDMMAALQQLQKECPQVSATYTIGKSVKGKDLVVFELSDHPGVEESGEPEFVYLAGLHGNELVGRELLFLLARHLCLGYGRNERITHILNNTRVHLLAVANPDGAEMAVEGSCSSQIGQNNANGVDLVEDFPVDSHDKEKPSQPESKAIFAWLKNRTSVIYASLHSGSLVVGYPFSEHWSLEEAGPSPTLDDDVFREAAKSYSMHHPTMSKGRPFCPGKQVQDHFKDGVVNVAQWSGHSFPLMDYQYVTGKGMGFAIFTGCCKAPNAEQLDGLWKNNKEALISFLEWSHKGISGYVYDSATKNAIPGVSIQVDHRDFITTTSKYGDYWRPLKSGSYKVTAKHAGYKPKDVIVHVDNDAEYTNITFALQRVHFVELPASVMISLVASCLLVILLVVLLVVRVCGRRKKRGVTAYMKNGFRPLQNEDDDLPNRNDSKVIGENGMMVLEESEISDDEDEEEVLFSNAEPKAKVA